MHEYVGMCIVACHTHSANYYTNTNVFYFVVVAAIFILKFNLKMKMCKTSEGICPAIIIVMNCI